MLSFRVFLVLAAFCFIGVFTTYPNSIQEKLKCSAAISINTVRCSNDISNNVASPVSCQVDCVCVHGVSRGECEEGMCVCYYDGESDDELQPLREQECSALADQVASTAVFGLLCTSVNAGVDEDIVDLCVADCICAHKLQNGFCENNAYTVNGTSLNLCRCTS